MKEYYSKMQKAKVGTTYNYSKKGMIINFIKISKYVWCIKIKYEIKGIKDEVLIFNTLCTTIEAAEFRKIWTEDER